MSVHVTNQIIKKEWTDYNDHLNMAYYVLIFDKAWEVVLEKFKIVETSAKSTKMSTMVVETHTTYNNEVKEGDEVKIVLTFLTMIKKGYFFRLKCMKKKQINYQPLLGQFLFVYKFKRKKSCRI